MNVNDTLLVTINLSDKVEDSTVEIVTYLGQYREVVNVFDGIDAEIIYKSLLNLQKQRLAEHLARLGKEVNLLNPVQAYPVSAIDIIKFPKEFDASFITVGKLNAEPLMVGLMVEEQSLANIPNIIDDNPVYILDKEEVDDLRWVKANPNIGKVATKIVDGKTVYILEKEDNNAAITVKDIGP